MVLGSGADLKAALQGLKGYASFWERKFNEPPVGLQNSNPPILAERPKRRKGISKKKRGRIPRK
jgi:hypothetical protein